MVFQKFQITGGVQRGWELERAYRVVIPFAGPQIYLKLMLEPVFSH